MADIWAWAGERHAIYLRKCARDGLAPAPGSDPLGWAQRPHPVGAPLTTDGPMSQFRFCNAYRELDRVTVWVREHIREPYAQHRDLWLMLCIARYINWPATLSLLISDRYPDAWPDSPTFSPEGLGRALDNIKAMGDKVYTGAYMIRAESDPTKPWFSWTKQRYIAEVVIGRLWEDREEWRAALRHEEVYGGHGSVLEVSPTLQEVWARLQHHRYVGWGPFMAYQAVVDMRWTPLLSEASDINTWTALGPGSRRGLNRLAGRPVAFALGQDQGLAEMRLIYRDQGEHRPAHMPPIDLSDIQNCLCEVDKWLRVKGGEGRPRAMYVEGRGW